MASRASRLGSGTTLIVKALFVEVGLRPTTTEASCVGLDPVVTSIAFQTSAPIVEPPSTVLGRF